MRTLHWRLTLWYGGMATVILILLASVLYFDVRVSLDANRRADVRDAVASASRILEETGSPDSAAGEVPRDVQVVIKDADGNVLAATPGSRPPFDSYSETRQDGRYLASTFSSQRIPGATGQVYVVLPTKHPVLRRLLLAEVAGVAGALALMVGLGYVLTKRTLRPLESVSTVAGELCRGKLGSRVNLPKLKSRRDEVGEVATSFDVMAESLEKLFEAERESKKTLRRFLDDASHELRTPLTSILGYLDVLDERGDEAAARRRALEAMRKEGGRMARLVEDLLVLARLDARGEAPSEDVDLVALAREVAGSYPGRRIALAAPDDEAVPVLADRESLRRVVSNLLSNATKHTPPEKKIQVSVARTGQEAVLRVSDEGEGIPKEALPHVFERFYREESSRAGEGSGLGLAIVWETVEALEGRVEVESTPGAGSTFTVRLPLLERNPKKEKPSKKN